MSDTDDGAVAAGDAAVGRHLRQDPGDLYQAPLQAVPPGVRTVWRTLLWKVFAEAVSVLSVLPYALPVSQSGTGVCPVFKVCVNKFITQDGDVKGAECHLS